MNVDCDLFVVVNVVVRLCKGRQKQNKSFVLIFVTVSSERSESMKEGGGWLAGGYNQRSMVFTLIPNSPTALNVH